MNKRKDEYKMLMTCRLENNLTCTYPALLLNLQGDTQSMHFQLLDHKQTLE